MSNQSLTGKRVLITQADRFMGPVLCQVFAEHGAFIIESTDSLISPDAPASVIAASGHIDVPVSYTHLDVYKRQAPDAPRPCGANHGPTAAHQSGRIQR